MSNARAVPHATRLRVFIDSSFRTCGLAPSMLNLDIRQSRSGYPVDAVRPPPADPRYLTPLGSSPSAIERDTPRDGAGYYEPFAAPSVRATWTMSNRAREDRHEAEDTEDVQRRNSYPS